MHIERRIPGHSSQKYTMKKVNNENKELFVIGNFNLYERVQIKDTIITGNIVLIHDEEYCDVLYDDRFAKGNQYVFTHNINELEKENINK